ncbi:uncharacterized protein LOC119402856 [Rhipicephalus sanguineus]|uniref:uncharacterized protein LOC119402856 n=1 Tax=Rhipicephalus sanguineus TaxID=34632 RepID=UPI001895CAD7|nr:uncharacterized protein LOC119402856 [Rhipicephalus sanguineus]
MEPSRKQCDCMFCPECKNIISAKVRLWLQEQPVQAEVEEQERKFEAAGEAGFSCAPRLAAKCSGAVEEVHAYARRLLECKMDSIESTESGSRTDTSIVGCGRSSSGESIAQERESASFQADDEALPMDAESGPSEAADSRSTDTPRDGP